jgi:hypothetical protein
MQDPFRHCPTVLSSITRTKDLACPTVSGDEAALRTADAY